MTDENFDFLETDTGDEVASFSKRFRDDPRASEIIMGLRRQGMSDREITIAFRLMARIPKEWEIEKEPDGKAAKRRAALAEKLKKLAIEIENDPDLSGLCFGVHTISYRTPEDDREDLTSLADFMREGVSELELQSLPTAALQSTAPVTSEKTKERTIALKKYAIKQIFSLIEKKGSRAPNKEVAALATILIGEKVTANDVTQARKNERRRYDPE